MPRRSGGLSQLRDDLSRVSGALRLPWQRSKHDDDPYWEAFINRPAADVRNLIPEIIGKAAEGNIFPTPSELHSPDVMASHLKELARYLDATSVTGIVDLSKQDPELAHGFPYAAVTAVHADNDPYVAPGVGGQTAKQDGQFVPFIVACWIRELGYRGSVKIEVSREQREHLAVTAGIATRDRDGRLTVPKLGTRVHIGEILFTDLPLQADG